jgi:hypothetical protein
MAEPKEITVSWPPLPLSEQGWRQRLDDLAGRAESLIGRKQIGLQDTAELAVELVGLLWPVLGSPETIAASCRASSAVGPPGLLMASTPFDQAAEIAARLDDIFAAAQADPAALVVELPAPMLQQVRPPDPRIGRKRQRPEPEPEDQPVDPEPAPAPSEDPDELPAAWRDCATPEPAPEPAPPATAQEPPAPPAPAAEVPAGWLLAADVAELLGISQVTVSRWRLDGKLGAEGQAWLQSGQSFAFEPNQIELLMDELAARKQASTERRPRTRVSDQRPPGWLTCDEFARAAGCSGRKARELVRYGEIPAEMVFRIGRRSQWINPEAVELWRRSA